jgi:hypothetical protein
VNHHFGHALERLRERYRLPEATAADVEAAAKAIRAGRAVRLRSEPSRRYGDGEGAASYLVRVAGVVAVAVYDERADALLTFLPKSYITEQRARAHRKTTPPRGARGRRGC